MEKAKKQNVPLELIVADGPTQQRPLDENVIKGYLGLQKDGVEFPAIEVVFDGQQYLVWDGFHRCECARRLGKKIIEAYVQPGNQRDALWLSFSANKDHGFPRKPGVAKKIIEQILGDMSWSKKSLSTIARHVGVTRQYIQKIKTEVEADIAHSSQDAKQNVDSEPGTKVRQNRDFQAKKGKKGVNSCTLLADSGPKTRVQRDAEVEVKSSRGKTYTQRSQEKEHRAPEPPKDAVGRVIPEHLRAVWARRSVLTGLLQNLGQIRAVVNRGFDERDPIFTLLAPQRFKADYENLRRTLRFATPYAVCPYCGGDGKDCKACRGFGFVNQINYDNAPREFKT